MNNICPTCGVDDEKTGRLLHRAPENIPECLNCHDTRYDGVFTIHDNLPRTDEQIIKMVTALVADGDVEIKHLTDRLEALCDPDGAPVDLYWLHHDDEGDSDGDFCWKHADALADYFNGETDEKPEGYGEYVEIPDWTPSADSVYIDGGWRSEKSSAAFCECCGCRLDFSPTDGFVEYEMEYYESQEPDKHWWSFRCFLEAALEYSREPAWCARVVLLAHKWIPMEG